MLPSANGKKSNDVSVTEAMKTMSLNNATTFYKAPCARDALMLGMGAGFGVGGVRGVLGGTSIKHYGHHCIKPRDFSDISLYRNAFYMVRL